MRKRTESQPPVESVRRAFAILESLNRRRVSTVSDLHKDTGLPKSTIVRLIDTLCTIGYAASDHREGGYLLTSGVNSLSGGFHGDPLFVEAIRPLALELTKKLKLPITVAVFDRDSMVVRYETYRYSAMSPFHFGINHRLKMLTRAMGRAYIGFCPDSERAQILDVLRYSDHPEDQIAHRTDEVEGIIARVRQNGFAERSSAVEPKSSSSVSVPVFQSDNVLGTVGLSYFTSAMPRSKALGLYLHHLFDLRRDAERRIEEISKASIKTY